MVVDRGVIGIAEVANFIGFFVICEVRSDEAFPEVDLLWGVEENHLGKFLHAIFVDYGFFVIRWFSVVDLDIQIMVVGLIWRGIRDDVIPSLVLVFDRLDQDFFCDENLKFLSQVTAFWRCLAEVAVRVQNILELKNEKNGVGNQ